MTDTTPTARAGEGAHVQTDAALLRVLADVANERDRQDARWGEQNHDDEIWLAILLEEVGELATAMLAARFHAYPHRRVEAIRAEAVQVAAVAVAFIECLDRQGGRREHE